MPSGGNKFNYIFINFKMINKLSLNKMLEEDFKKNNKKITKNETLIKIYAFYKLCDYLKFKFF